MHYLDILLKARELQGREGYEEHTVAGLIWAAAANLEHTTLNSEARPNLRQMKEMLHDLGMTRADARRKARRIVMFNDTGDSDDAWRNAAGELGVPMDKLHSAERKHMASA